MSVAAQPEPPEPERGPEITRAPATACAIGFVSGALSALLGIGGGLVMVPGLVFLLRIRHRRATGTAFVVLLPVALAVVFSYHQSLAARQGSGLALAALGWLALGELLGALLLRPALPSLRAWRRWLGLPLLGIAVWMGAQPFLSGTAAAALARTSTGTGSGLALVAAGLAAGAASAALGLGGGVLTVPALALLLGYGQYRAQGMGLAVTALVSIPVALLHLMAGNVVDSLAGWLLAGAVFGSWIAAANVFTTPPEALRLFFGILLGVVAITTLLRRAPRGTSEPQMNTDEHR